MPRVPVIKVMPWSKSQGDFVLINESDFDPKIHKKYEPKAPTTPPPALNNVSAAVKKKLEAAGLKAEEVEGTGKDGVITVADVKKATEDKEKTADVTALYVSEEAEELANELGFKPEELAAIKGTGENGLITVEDLEKAIDKE